MKRTTNIDVIEERVCNMKKQNDIDHATILNKIEEINNKLDNSFVPINRYLPIEKIVYGMVTLVLVGVIGAIIKLVIL
jgi:hypothetical protein